MIFSCSILDVMSYLEFISVPWKSGAWKINLKEEKLKFTIIKDLGMSYLLKKVFMSMINFFSSHFPVICWVSSTLPRGLSHEVIISW